MDAGDCSYNVKLTVFDDSKADEVGHAVSQFVYLLEQYHKTLPDDNKRPFSFAFEAFLNDFSRFTTIRDLGAKILIIATRGEEPVVAMYASAQPDLMTSERTFTVEHMIVVIGHDKAAKAVDDFARQMANAYRCTSYINTHWSEP